jgi:hypothetical protein
MPFVDEIIKSYNTPLLGMYTSKKELYTQIEANRTNLRFLK